MPIVLRILDNSESRTTVTAPPPDPDVPPAAPATAAAAAPRPARPNPQRSLSFRGRLMREIQEFYREPYPGIEFTWVGVDTEEQGGPRWRRADAGKACLVLKPLSGPLKGIPLHFTMRVPENYPEDPPAIEVDHRLEHPHVYGDWICADILQVGHNNSYDRGRTYSGGYTPAYTLMGISIQVLSFFTNYKIPNDHNGFSTVQNIKADSLRNVMTRVYRPGEYTAFVKCKFCEYDGEKVWHRMTPIVKAREERAKARADKVAEVWRVARDDGRKAVGAAVGSATDRDVDGDGAEGLVVGDAAGTAVAAEPSVGASVPPLIPTKAQIKAGLDAMLRLPDEVWLAIAEHLTIETLRVASDALPDTLGRVFIAHNIQRRRELICFFTRESYATTVLGFGVYVNPKSNRMVSEFDYLSRQAFHGSKVRLSVWKKPLTFWVPFAIDSESHFQRAVPWLRTAVNVMGKSVLVPKFLSKEDLDCPEAAVMLLTKMMNHMVVALFDVVSEQDGKKADRAVLVQASEKAVEGYVSILHLLLCLVKRFPFLQAGIDQHVDDFLAYPEARLKSSTPDLGEWLIYLGLSSTKHWSPQVAKAVLPEFLTRNVLWMVRPRVKQVTGKVTREDNDSNDDDGMDLYNDAPAAGAPRQITQETVTQKVRQDSPYAHLLYLETDPVCDIRLTDTWTASSTSLRLLLFQVFFLTRIFRPAIPGGVMPLEKVLKGLDSRLGQAPAHMVESTFGAIQTIQRVEHFGRFLQLLGGGMERMGKAGATAALRRAVLDSERRGYHRPGRHGLAELRELREKAIRLRGTAAK